MKITGLEAVRIAFLVVIVPSVGGVVRVTVAGGAGLVRVVDADVRIAGGATVAPVVGAVRGVTAVPFVAGIVSVVVPVDVAVPAIPRAVAVPLPAVAFRTGVPAAVAPGVVFVPAARRESWFARRHSTVRRVLPPPLFLACRGHIVVPAVDDGAVLPPASPPCDGSLPVVHPVSLLGSWAAVSFHSGLARVDCLGSLGGGCVSLFPMPVTSGNRLVVPATGGHA